MPCCAVERVLDLESGATTQRLTLTPTGVNSMLITISMSFHICIQKIKDLDQIICHSAPKMAVIPGKKKKGINKEKRNEKEREEYRKVGTKELF